MKEYVMPDFDKIIFESEEIITISITVGSTDPDVDPDRPWGPVV